MLKKLAHYAAVATIVAVPVGFATGCALVSSVGSLVQSQVPQNVAQGASMLSTVLTGLQSGLETFGLWSDLSAAEQGYFTAAENAAQQMAQATSTAAGGTELEQGEAAINSMVASLEADCNLPAGTAGALTCTPLETGLLSVATAALPAIEAVVPLVAGAHAPAKMAAAAPNGLTPAQAYAEMQKLAQSQGLFGALGL